MCSGPDKSKSRSTSSSSSVEEGSNNIKDMKNLTVHTDDSFSSLLEFASNNDFEEFKVAIASNVSLINEVGFWYVRQKGSKQIVLEHRTPLMVAASYGSIDILKLVLSCPEADVNFACGNDKSTALHCAASGGSVNAVEAVKLLLSAGANINCMDANGNRPVDVIVVPPKPEGVKTILEELLADSDSDSSVDGCSLPLSVNSSSPRSAAPLSSTENGSPSSPVATKFSDAAVNSASEKKEYPIDPSLPDIKNSIYATDEFRMFSFKVRPCSRAYSHDWTECPFVHPGENARRRDPRKFHYSCVPCPDFRKGACRRGDMCEYAHGVFECWLHPAQYRTRLCKDGTSCNRRVCFFAHLPEELRPLYVSTGSAVPSPRSAASAPNVMDMAAAMSLFPGSPSSMSPMSPSPFAQPISPSGNGISHSNNPWPQPNVPALHLPGSNIQTSRLRSSLCARDMPLEDFNNMMQDFDGQQHILNDINCFSQPRLGAISVSRSGRSKTLTPSNLEDLFSAEVSSSPWYSDPAAASVFSPTHKSASITQTIASIPLGSGNMVAGNGAFGSLPSASEITKRNILAADDRFGSSGMVQPLVSPLSNRLILPQVGKTNDGTASVDSSTVNEAAAVSGRVFSPSVVPGMQWRPGSPFPNQKDAGQLRGRTEIAPDQREKFFCRSFSKCNKGPVPFLICLPLLQEIISSFLPNNKVHLLQQFISLISSLNLLQSSENHRLLVHLNLIILIRFDHTHVCQFHCRSNYNPSVNHQTPSGSNNPLPLVFDIPCAIWRRTARPLTDFGFGGRSIWEGGVGLFLVSGAVLLALSLAWLKGFQIRSKFRKYTATFEFSQASGISTGTPVRIRGVTVGDVIRVNPSLTSIEAVVEIEDDKTIIPCNSLVEVNQSGLLMETIIDITPRDPIPTPSAGPLDQECHKEGLIVCDRQKIKGYQGVSLDALVGIFTRLGRDVEKIGIADTYSLAERAASVIEEAKPLLTKV